MYLPSSTIYVHNSHFCNSKAKNDGGVIYALSATMITAHNSFFDSNESGYAAVIYVVGTY